MSRMLKRADETISKGRSSRRRSPFDFIPGTRIDDFLGPWVAVVFLSAVGLILRNVSWGFSTALARIAAFMAITVCASVVSWVLWEYAAPRHPFLRMHAFLSVHFYGMILSLTVLCGAAKVWIWIVVFGGSTLALSWNVRDLNILRGKGTDSHGAEDPYGIGIDQATVTMLRSAIDRGRREGRPSIMVRLVGRGGRGYSDIAKALPALNNLLSLPKNSLRAIEASSEGSNIADMSIILQDNLINGVSLMQWDGVRRSIADGIHFAQYENGDPFILRPTGGPGLAPFQIQIMGTTRSGKSHAFRVFVLMLSRMSDVVLWVCDATKANQTVGILRPAINRLEDNQDGATCLLRDLQVEIKTRGDWLDAHGLDEWRRECGIPAHVVWVEEGADILPGTDLWEKLQRASLSCGIFLVDSMQSARGTNKSTGARAMAAGSLCFGVTRKTEARFAFPEHPDMVELVSKWGTSRQGQFLALYPSVSDLHRSMAIRTPYHDGMREEIEREIIANAPGMAEPDETILSSASPYVPPSVRGSFVRGSFERTNHERTVVVTPSVRRESFVRAVEAAAVREPNGRVIVRPRELGSWLSTNADWYSHDRHRTWLQGILADFVREGHLHQAPGETGVYVVTGEDL